MKGVELTETGGPEVMHLREIARPTPQQDEVLIRVAVTGVNFIDLYVREGRYGNKIPFTLGQEAAVASTIYVPLAKLGFSTTLLRTVGGPR